MSNTMNEKKGFLPMFPGMKAMPFPPCAGGWFGAKDGDNDACKGKWKDLKSNLGNFRDQVRDMQDSAREASKDRWNRCFSQMLEMQETFAGFLPGEAPSLPGMPAWFAPMSPRAFLERMRSFQEMCNEHAIAQADSFFDFCRQGQQQLMEMISEALEKAEACKVEDGEAAEGADDADIEVVVVVEDEDEDDGEDEDEDEDEEDGEDEEEDEEEEDGEDEEEDEEEEDGEDGDGEDGDGEDEEAGGDAVAEAGDNNNEAE